MRPVLGLLSSLMLCACVAACGSGSDAHGDRVGSPVVEHVLTVSPVLGPLDADDYGDLDLGHAAQGNELRGMTALVKRYYAIAAAGSGAAACATLYSPILQEVLEEYGPSQGVHRASCAAVMSDVFQKRHEQLVADLDSLKIVRVRSNGLNGIVFMRFASKTAVTREFDMRLVGGTWKLAQPSDTIMP